MAKTYPVIERAGGRITVLARTAEEAHEAVSRELGSGCSIVSVERVRSGGLGGFFATELVRLVAAPRRINTGVEEAPSFASAEDLVFALPGGGGQFAARLQEELAALTTKGMVAAEATMGRTAPAPLPSAVSERSPERSDGRSYESHDDRDFAVSEPWATVTEPVARIAPPSPERAPDPDPTLPSSDDLLWGTTEETPRRWGRARTDRRDDELDPAVAEHPVEPSIDEATLLAAWTEVESRTDEPRYADGFDVPAPAAAPVTAPPAAPVHTAWESLPSDPDEALLAQMLATELEIDDRAITPRARLIRGGIRSVVDTSSCEGEPTPTPDASPYDDHLDLTSPPSSGPISPDPISPGPISSGPASTAEPVTFVVGEREPAAPTPLSSEPTPRLESERPALPVRQRMLVATPVAPLGSWSAPTLRAFGVPDGIVDRMTAQSPVDDLEWTVAFMLSVRDLCRHLPSGPGVLVGPSGANLARQLGLMSCSGDELTNSNLSVASPNAGPVTLRRSAGGRHVHLVVGGNWHHLVTVRPTVVSASTEHDLLEALRVAEAWGACLGWTLDGGRYVRIDPYLLAGRVRGLLPDRSELSSVDQSLFPLAD